MRYIDADALLNMLPDDLPYKASVKRVLMQAPTADVDDRINHLTSKTEAQEAVIKELTKALDKAIHDADRYKRKLDEMIDVGGGER